MDYLIKIKQMKEEFTPADQKIAQYIIDNPQLILESNSSQLAEIIETSQSAVVRFVKKIGYKGYVDLKIDIAKSFEDENGFIKDEVIEKGDNIAKILAKSKNNILTTTDKTYALLDEENIKKIVKLIIDSDAIYLAGVGSSGLVCEDFLFKLQRTGKLSFYHQDPHTNLSILTNIKKNDILLCISYSGITKEVILASEYAKEIGAPVVAITKSYNNALGKVSDFILLLPEIEKEMRFAAISSRISSQIITDILYYGYLAQNMDATKENIKVSKELTSKLKDK